MIILILVLLALFFMVCATVRFRQSLTKPGGLLRKVWQWVTDIFDAILGIG